MAGETMGAGMSNGKLGMRATASQQQVLTPQLLQSIRLLQLSTQELEQEIAQALEANVMLEDSDDIMVELPSSDTDSSERCDDAAPDAEAAGVEADFSWSSADSWSSGESGYDGMDEDGEGWVARLREEAPQDARSHALRQLAQTVNDPRMALLAAAIVDEVDDNGYLCRALDSFPTEVEGASDISAAEWRAALRLVQGVEPTGFGARNLRECLELQLAELPAGTPGLLTARRIVAEALELAGRGNELRLAGALDLRPSQVNTALELIRGLDPKPGTSFQVDPAAVVPDLLITGSEGQWRVELNPETLPRLRINSQYERLVGERVGGHKALRDQLNEARWLMRGLEMRYDTLLKTAQAVFGRQIRFLSVGEEGMAPLNMREVADAIGMHESTICRVVANKHVATPWGIYTLKSFFPVQLSGRDSDISGTAVRARLRRLIDAESASRPYSDGELAALLARDGITIARRTVAKYREAMSIPPAPARLRPALSNADLRLAS